MPYDFEQFIIEPEPIYPYIGIGILVIIAISIICIWIIFQKYYTQPLPLPRADPEPPLPQLQFPNKLPPIIPIRNNTIIQNNLNRHSNLSFPRFDFGNYVILPVCLAMTDLSEGGLPLSEIPRYKYDNTLPPFKLPYNDPEFGILAFEPKIVSHILDELGCRLATVGEFQALSGNISSLRTQTSGVGPLALYVDSGYIVPTNVENQWKYMKTNNLQWEKSQPGVGSRRLVSPIDPQSPSWLLLAIEKNTDAYRKLANFGTYVNKTIWNIRDVLGSNIMRDPGTVMLSCRGH